MTQINMTVNGKAAKGDVEGRTLLVQFLRENLGMTGTHVGCDTSQCGACVVHVDGVAVKSAPCWPLKHKAQMSPRLRARQRQTARSTPSSRHFRTTTVFSAVSVPPVW